ncbi:MAG: hypothetical protein LLF76_07035 [Planctomycetaceae bacterium]|nr:hypothetical protein [Planctomycetaceae bacterium]
MTAHFADALRGCQSENERQTRAQELIAGFGDVKLLGTLIRRGKKRCRPLWQKALIVTSQAAGLLILLCLLRAGCMYCGRPTISVDYSQWMTEKVRDARDESLNALHEYLKAIDLMQKDMPEQVEKILAYPLTQEKTPEDWAAIEAFLEHEKEAIAAFRAGAAKPFYWNHYQLNAEHGADVNVKVVEKLLPQMSAYKRLALLVARLQIPFSIFKGHDQEAVADTLSLCRFGHHLLSDSTLLEGLVGIAMEALSWQSVNQLLVQQSMSSQNMLQFQQLIESDYDPKSAMMGEWRAEKAFWYDQVQRSFTDDGNGNGRPLPKGTLFVAKDLTDYVRGFVLGFPDRRQAVESIDMMFAESERSKQIHPGHLAEAESLERIMENAGFMQQVGFPAMRKTLEIGWRLRCGQAGLIGTLSICRFEKEQGRLPQDWNELFKQGYLKQIPMDPYSGGPLVYRKTTDGFILYSVGPNFVDDGGVLSTDKNGNERQWGENGDWILWPIKE